MARERTISQRRKLVAYLERQMVFANVRRLFVAEHRVSPLRKFRFDYYAPAYRLAVEVHGGIFTGGRHTSGSGFANDRCKMNMAAELGITVLEYWREPVESGNAMCQILRVLEQRGWREGA